MTLYSTEKALKMKILLNIFQKDTEDVLDPLYNHYKIYDREIMNAKIDRNENLDINNRASYIIYITREWIKKPFNLDPVPQNITF